jgi:hypothetical protein
MFHKFSASSTSCLLAQCEAEVLAYASFTIKDRTVAVSKMIDSLNISLRKERGPNAHAAESGRVTSTHNPSTSQVIYHQLQGVEVALVQSVLEALLSQEKVG